MAEKEVAPPHLPRPVSERAVLLKTGRASEEFCVPAAVASGDGESRCSCSSPSPSSLQEIGHSRARKACAPQARWVICVLLMLLSSSDFCCIFFAEC
jgi:hypothetical protein